MKVEIYTVTDDSPGRIISWVGTLDCIVIAEVRLHDLAGNQSVYLQARNIRQGRVRVYGHRRELIVSSAAPS